jgi:hypothetical protein
MIVVPAPRAIVVPCESWAGTDRANKVVINPSPNSETAVRSPEDSKNDFLAMSFS